MIQMLEANINNAKNNLKVKKSLNRLIPMKF